MKYNELEALLEEGKIIFLTYGGFLTQSLIAGMIDALEKEVRSNDLSTKISTHLFTIFIELAQNMMNYAKTKYGQDAERHAKGLIIVGMESDPRYYYVISRNIVDASDKAKLTEHFQELEGLDKESLRTLYRAKRKAGKEKHHQGAGIGFVEVVRRCDAFEYTFTPTDTGHYYFTFKTIIHQPQESL